MAVHGHVRATRDLDLVVLAPSLRLPEVFAIVRAQGLEGEGRELIEAIRERYVAVPFVTAEDLVVLKLLWRRARDVADVHALVAAADPFDGKYVRETLAGLLPADDPRHEEVADLLRRFRP